MFLWGSFNEWKATEQFEYLGNNRYQVSVFLSKTSDGSFHEMKISTENWNTKLTFSKSDISEEIDINTNIVLTEGGDNSNNNMQLSISQEGEYLFLLTAEDSSAPTLYISPVSE